MLEIKFKKAKRVTICSNPLPISTNSEMIIEWWEKHKGAKINKSLLEKVRLVKNS